MKLTKSHLEDLKENKSIRVGGKDITSIEAFPDDIDNLNITGTNIKKLPKLPDTLVYLVIRNNFFLKELPEFSPSLKNLYCEYNSLITLPKLPDGLLYLFCNNNKLIELPYLPETLMFFACGGNKDLNKLYSKTLNEILKKQKILLRKKKLKNVI